MQNGLICYPVGGNVDGTAATSSSLPRPTTAPIAELTEIVDKTARSIREVLAAEGLA